MNRTHTLKQAADQLGLSLESLRRLARRSGAPVDHPGRGLPIYCNPDELAAFARSHGLTGKRGRPRTGTSPRTVVRRVMEVPGRVSARIVGQPVEVAERVLRDELREALRGARGRTP